MNISTPDLCDAYPDLARIVTQILETTAANPLLEGKLSPLNVLKITLELKKAPAQRERAR
jgi:hypothetical protein